MPCNGKNIERFTNGQGIWAFFWKMKTLVRRTIAEWRKWKVLRKNGNCGMI